MRTDPNERPHGVGGRAAGKGCGPFHESPAFPSSLRTEIFLASSTRTNSSPVWAKSEMSLLRSLGCCLVCMATMMSGLRAVEFGPL